MLLILDFYTSKTIYYLMMQIHCNIQKMMVFLILFCFFVALFLHVIIFFYLLTSFLTTLNSVMIRTRDSGLKVFSQVWIQFFWTYQFLNVFCSLHISFCSILIRVYVLILVLVVLIHSSFSCYINSFQRIGRTKTRLFQLILNSSLDFLDLIFSFLSYLNSI